MSCYAEKRANHTLGRSIWGVRSALDMKAHLEWGDKVEVHWHEDESGRSVTVPHQNIRRYRTERMYFSPPTECARPELTATLSPGQMHSKVPSRHTGWRWARPVCSCDAAKAIAAVTLPSSSDTAKQQ